MSKPGKNIKKLAWTRKFASFKFAFLSTGVFYLTLVYPQEPKLFWYLTGASLSLWLMIQSKNAFRHSKFASQGAKAEQRFATMLQRLPQNWRAEFNRPVPGIGDIDVILTSPTGKTWVIDIKSHKDNIQTDGLKVYCTGKYPLSGDFISSSKDQAYIVSKTDHISNVTPVIFFLNAYNCPNRYIDGVYVTNQFFWE